MNPRQAAAKAMLQPKIEIEISMEAEGEEEPGKKCKHGKTGKCAKCEAEGYEDDEQED